VLKLQAFLRLLCVWALLLAPSIASAHAPVHPETRVGDFEVAAEACVRLSALANGNGHQENGDASTAEASGYPHATRGGPKLLPQVSRTARLTQGGVEHIALRHFPTSGATRAGKFATSSLRQVRSLINETVQKGAVRANTRGRPGHIFEHDFGTTIGMNIQGGAATRLRVVVTPDGAVKTAFPF